MPRWIARARISADSDARGGGLPSVRPGGSRPASSSSCRCVARGGRTRASGTSRRPAPAAMSVCFLSSTLSWISPWNALNFDSRSLARDLGLLGGLCLGHQYDSSFSDFLLILDTVISEYGDDDHEDDQVRHPRPPAGRHALPLRLEQPQAGRASATSARDRARAAAAVPSASHRPAPLSGPSVSWRAYVLTSSMSSPIEHVVPAGSRIVGAGLRLIRHGPRFYHVRRNSIMATTSSSASSSSSRRRRGESAQSNR